MSGTSGRLITVEVPPEAAEELLFATVVVFDRIVELAFGQLAARPPDTIA